MMINEMMIKYVVDLETAKKLKDYLPEGFNSYFGWVVHCVDYVGKLILTESYKEHPDYNFYPAPILEEMLELLPKQIDADVYQGLLIDIFDRQIRYCNSEYRNDIEEAYVNIYESQSKATAAAKLYMWLADEGYIIKETTNGQTETK